jgi:hypothetical protein
MSGPGSDGSLRQAIDASPVLIFPRRYRALGLENQAKQRVVVQVLPDAGQVVDHVYADLAEMAGRPDTGQEQQLR